MNRLIIITIFITSLMTASWFLLPVESVTVSGNNHLSVQQITQATETNKGSPWLWITAWRTDALAKNPWISQARITKYFPNRVEIHVTERKAFALLIESNNKSVVIAQDGMVLPNAQIPKFKISGWGSSRLTESLKIVTLVGVENIQQVQFSPQGFTISTAKMGIIWTNSYESLLKYGGSVKIEQGSRVNVYPWGVSAQ